MLRNEDQLFGISVRVCGCRQPVEVVDNLRRVFVFEGDSRLRSLSEDFLSCNE